MRTLVLLLIAVIAPLAHALDYQPVTAESVAERCKPTIEKGGNYSQCFVRDVKSAAALCGSAAGVSASDASRCAVWAESVFKAGYDLALPVVKETPAATDALKEIYVYALATVRNFPSASSGTRVEFRRMEEQRRLGTEERIARLQLEAPTAVPPPPTAEQLARQDKMVDCTREASSKGVPPPQFPAFLKACLAR